MTSLCYSRIEGFILQTAAALPSTGCFLPQGAHSRRTGSRSIKKSEPACCTRSQGKKTTRQQRLQTHMHAQKHVCKLAQKSKHTYTCNPSNPCACVRTCTSSCAMLFSQNFFVAGMFVFRFAGELLKALG